MLQDISVSYTGQWAAVIGSLQPALVDAGFRGRSEERLLPREGLVAQSHIGPEGRKQVTRRTAPNSQGDVQVSFNQEVAVDIQRRAAAALVADGYALFLLGPMFIAGSWAAERRQVLEVSEPETIRVDGQEHGCDVLRVSLAPGLGFSTSDQLALFIDRRERLMRRVRFSLNGLESTRGAVAEVDASGHILAHGVHWPSRFHERLLRPLPLPVHDWTLTGLDVNRGISVAEVTGPSFSGRAAAPATPLVL
ncbi:hypothetical protein [Muricoccus radiodurans]|uniref:hypothetical protein n=1 Tax=Muricoccus radiodurans TaxID=2231721 RepID=UPI003CF180FD